MVWHCCDGPFHLCSMLCPSMEDSSLQQLRATSPWAQPLFSLVPKVIICFGLAVLLHQYVGFALVALLVEINSIFLHLRQILLMANLVHTTCYRLNSLINLGTYVVFRIATLAWMTHWLFLNRQNVPPATYAVGTVGMAIMTPMNIILFYRLLRSDFFKSRRDVRREKEE